MRVKIEQIHDLLAVLPPSSSVSITRPVELAGELFTHKGSGTLVRRGERVQQADAWQQLDLPRLRTLVESAFGRRLAADYFERTRMHRAFASAPYRATELRTSHAAGTHLQPFAGVEEA